MNPKTAPAPAATLPLTERSAASLAAAIRAGETSAIEVVDAHLDLIARRNPEVNAIVVERFDEAREEARAADERIAAAAPGENLPPLLGVPVTVKESICFEGLPNACGLVARREALAEANAPVVERIRDAGAIVLGLTNLSELTMWIETENRVYGRTNNAYDSRRTAGGSSGGEGASVGSGFAPLGIGSDIGGSIRFPAFCGGVFGHKPSFGLVPSTGAYPPVPTGETARLFANGPLARRAEDLMPALRILAGPDGEDPHARDYDLGDPAEVDFEGMRVVLPERCFISPISGEILAARERAAAALAARGAVIERRPVRSMVSAMERYLTALSDSGAASLTMIMAEAGAASLGGWDYLARGGPHTVATRLLLAGERLTKGIPPSLSKRSIRAGRAFAEATAELIGDGVILHPPAPAPAPLHGRTIGRFWWIQPMAVFNLASVPVTEVPMGLGRAGIPLGVQVAAAPGRDHVSIAAAIELERVFGGWVPPQA